MDTKAELRAFERTRAASVVKAYEDELRDKLSANPGAKNAQQVETIIYRLFSLRSQIMGSMKPYKPKLRRDPGNEFSLEEIEAAMDMIGTEVNPFEEN